jgi:FdhD protein
MKSQVLDEGSRATRTVSNIAYRGPQWVAGRRDAPEETPVALVYDGTAYAVMMATPSDLEDFGLGFSLTERIVERATRSLDIEVAEVPGGFDLRMWLGGEARANFRSRLRRLAGPVGCGLCGLESIAEAMRQSPRIASNCRFEVGFIAEAVTALESAQALSRATRATHAAAFVRSTCGLVALREDVGRHNALDKLAGALASGNENTADGAVVLTSRVSVEMVQKSAIIGTPLIIAISAPTALAVRTAQAANITLVAIVRGTSFEVFTCPERLCLA